MTSPKTLIRVVRFRGDIEGARAILQDPECSELIRSVGRGAAIRKELLGNAVRIDEGILPDLATSLANVQDRAKVSASLELFVYECPSIQACVFPTSSRYIVLLSSGCVERLAPNEIEFVIGHELGHVAYEHFEIPVGAIMNANVPLDPKQAMMLLNWQRKTEISADRAGLLCCGSLDTAASALFKTVSGLATPGLKIDALRLAQQFDELKEEIWRDGAEGMWTITHPFPSLRMKALIAFWESSNGKYLLEDISGNPKIARCDNQIEDLLAFMDPMMHRDQTRVDPLLLPFVTWAGLFIAGSNSKIEKEELTTLAGFIGETDLRAALKAPRNLDTYRSKFRNALKKREHPLSALDINRILACLIAIAHADGAVDEHELAAVREIALDLGVAESYVSHLFQEMCE